MHIIPIESIIISPTRQRREFDADKLQDLISSIEQIGLLQAPILRSTPAGFELVAGERRLRALQDLWALGVTVRYNDNIIEPGTVPYVTLGEIDTLVAEEAELDENIKRADLTWQERAAAHQRLHALRQKQREALQSEPTEAAASEWTVADTAMELHGRSDGAYQDKTRKELIVSEHLNNPEVKAAKSVDEAFKILKKQETTAKNIEIAERIGKTFSSSIHQLHNINCLEWMAAYIDDFADGYEPQIDVILTDPPYGMGADKFNDGGGKLTTIQHHYEDSYENWQRLMSGWCELSYKVCKPQAHAYVFCDIDRFHELKRFMEDAGWYVFRTPLIATKPDSGRVPLPDRGPRRQWEAILYAIKGKKPVTHIYPDVISTTADSQLYHGAQKPIALFKNLLQRSVQAGDVVLDCFAGTGTIIPAAHSFKCKAIVIEQEKEYFGVCLQRVKDLEEGE